MLQNMDEHGTTKNVYLFQARCQKYVDSMLPCSNCCLSKSFNGQTVTFVLKKTPERPRMLCKRQSCSVAEEIDL